MSKTRPQQQQRCWRSYLGNELEVERPGDVEISGDDAADVKYLVECLVVEVLRRGH